MSSTTDTDAPKVPVVIIGCGPAGLTTAIELAKRGVPSLVLEKRSHDDIHNAVLDSSTFGISGKSYAVALRQRGLELLRSVSNDAYESILASSLTNAPSTLWLNGKKRVLASDDTNVLTTRDTVVVALLSVVESTYSKLITIRYQTQVQRIEAVAGATAVVLGSNPAPDVRIDAPVLVGADGVHSAVRRYMKEQGYLTEEIFEDLSPYKVVSIVQCEAFRGGFHVFVKRGVGNAILTPFVDGTLSLTLLPVPDVTSSGFQIMGEATPERIQALAAAVKEHFPQLYGVLMQHNEDVFEKILRAKAFTGKTVKCSRYNHEKIVLVGDAAHATLPTTSQGLTGAVRGVVHLFEVDHWDGRASSASAAFERFSRSYQAEGEALFEAGKWVSLNRWKMKYVVFMMTMQKLDSLHNRLPNVFTPSLYKSFNTPTISYADAWRTQKQRAFALWIAICAVIACLMISVVFTLHVTHLCAVWIILLPGLKYPNYLISMGKHASVLCLCTLATFGPWQGLYTVCIVAYTLRLAYFNYNRNRQDSFAHLEQAHRTKMEAVTFRQRLVMLCSLGVLYNCYLLPIAAPRQEDAFGLEVAGMVLMVAGGFLQALADQTKSRFKALNPDSLCREGVYKLCRHPNYLGEILVWFGFGIGLYPYDGWPLGILASVGIKGHYHV